MVDSTVSPAKAGTRSKNTELADVVRRFAPEYTSQYAHAMMPSQKKALADIAACCTEALGGRLYRCDDCNKSFWRFYYCRNRACPKCQASRTQEWLQRREAELLPCGYFHAVATVPSELRDAFRRNQKFMCGLLMRVSADAIKELCAKKRHLGGLPGILAVLHTWTGDLQYHPHAHMLVTAGGITPNGEDWEPARGEFLVPVGVLSRKIAAMFRDALKKQKPQLLASIPARVWRREWVSFVKHYGHGNDAVLNYLSRYVFRTAISNTRILNINATHVTFRSKDRVTDTWRIKRLPGVEFLGRFLQHVLPRGFHKVRYYGLWHHSRRPLASRAWLLLIVEKPAGQNTDPRHAVDSNAAHRNGPMKIADLLEAFSQLATLVDQQETIAQNDDADNPCCPHCGSAHTTLLGEWPPPGRA